MKPRLKLTTLYLTARQRAALKRRAAATGISRSELIRMAIDIMLGDPPRGKAVR
jgi:hypothetical protein